MKLGVRSSGTGQVAEIGYQQPNYVLAGPASGTATADPTFRALVAKDLPAASQVDSTTLAFGDSSPKTMFTLPANAVVLSVQCIVDTAFDGTPTASVGISGTAAKYMATTDNDLTASAGTVFEVHPGLTADASTEALIITYSAGGATVGSARFLVSYSVPS